MAIKSTGVSRNYARSSANVRDIKRRDFMELLKAQMAQDEALFDIKADLSMRRLALEDDLFKRRMIGSYGVGAATQIGDYAIKSAFPNKAIDYLRMKQYYDIAQARETTPVEGVTPTTQQVWENAPTNLMRKPMNWRDLLSRGIGINTNNATLGLGRTV